MVKTADLAIKLTSQSSVKRFLEYLGWISHDGFAACQ